MIALDTNDLLSCPQCGAETYRITGWQAPPHQLLWVECGHCRASLSANMPEPVIVRGQTLADMSVEQLRALHDQLIEEIEAVEEELEQRL